MVTEHSKKNIVRTARRQTPGCVESRTESWYEGGGSSDLSQCFVASSYEGGESTDSPATCPACPPVPSLSFPPLPVTMVRILVLTFEIHVLVRNEWSPVGCNVSCRALSCCPEGSTPALSMSCGARLFWVGSGVELVFVVLESFPLQPPLFDQANKQYNTINARWPIPVSIITAYRNSIGFLCCHNPNCQFPGYFSSDVFRWRWIVASVNIITLYAHLCRFWLGTLICCTFRRRWDIAHLWNKGTICKMPYFMMNFRCATCTVGAFSYWYKLLCFDLVQKTETKVSQRKYAYLMLLGQKPNASSPSKVSDPLHF